MGLATLGVTLRKDRIAVMSCNPAIGGTAKGHLVRELDALGGAMGRVADLTGIPFKTLNESRGPAVRASRVLCERDAYAAEMHRSLVDQGGLSICEAEVVEIVTAADAVHGVVLKGKGFVPARTVILTTGKFLQLLGFELGRFKTGTPPRLRRDSIDYARCEPQPGDERPKPLSSRTLQT